MAENVYPLVVEDLKKRVAKGTREYGVPLHTFNGRDPLWDAYEEALDLSMYLRQALAERRKLDQVSEIISRWYLDGQEGGAEYAAARLKEIRDVLLS